MKILYPDGPRQVDEETVLAWAWDSYANNADRLDCSQCGHDTRSDYDPTGCQHTGTATPVYFNPTPEPLTLEAAMDWLQDTGEATFAKEDG